MNQTGDAARPVFTPLQGQYLAFIHAYTLVNGRPPAEHEMMRFFQVTPPTVHRMVVTLEQAGLISRQPGTPRSIVVLVQEDHLPRLKPGFAQTVKTSVTRYSHVRHFKQQAQKFLACPSSCSAWPPLSKAGGTIMKRRLIML
jgi:SOS-response transcriptional repressor LexA